MRRTVSAGEQAFGAGESARAVGLDTIERPARREGLDLPAVQHLGVDTARKIVERDEIALGALGDERLHRLFADALERAERIADRESLIAAPDRDISLAVVDRRRRDRSEEHTSELTSLMRNSY